MKKGGQSIAATFPPDKENKLPANAPGANAPGRENQKASTSKTTNINLRVKNLKASTSKTTDINLRVKNLQGNTIFFKIKRGTKMKKLMTAYCDRNDLDYNVVNFLFDGKRIRGHQTPAQLGLKDGDELHAFIHQTGGGVSKLSVHNSLLVAALGSVR